MSCSSFWNWLQECACHIVNSMKAVWQAQLGDIVFVELPEVGAELEKEGQFGVVESVKVIVKLQTKLFQFCPSNQTS